MYISFQVAGSKFPTFSRESLLPAQTLVCNNVLKESQLINILSFAEQFIILLIEEKLKYAGLFGMREGMGIVEQYHSY